MVGAWARAHDFVVVLGMSPAEEVDRAEITFTGMVLPTPITVSAGPFDLTVKTEGLPDFQLNLSIKDSKIRVAKVERFEEADATRLLTASR